MRNSDRIPPNQLHEELVKRGVTLPSPPSFTFAPRGRWPEFIHVECGHNEAKKTKKHP